MGDRIAMYTGDYLFAKSLECITNIEIPEAHQALSHTILEVCKGEIEQIKDKYNYDQNLRTYLRRIKRKTALLIAASCQLGAIAAGANRDTVSRLFWYGYFVGMSYQIIDDILDFVSTEEKLGKPAGAIYCKETLRFLPYMLWKIQSFVRKSDLYMKIQQRTK